MRPFPKTALAAAAAIAITACSSGPPDHDVRGLPPAPPAAGRVRHLPGVVDLAGPRGDGSFSRRRPGGCSSWPRRRAEPVRPRARGGYQTARGTEPYLVMVNGVSASTGPLCVHRGHRLRHPAWRPASGHHRSTRAGRARRFASLAARAARCPVSRSTLPGGSGKGRRSWGESGGKTTVFGIGCDGRLATVTAWRPAGGRRHRRGACYARRVRRLSHRADRDQRPGVAASLAGKFVILVPVRPACWCDIGVESAASPRPGSGRQYLADRFSPGNRHPGDDAILRLSAAGLARAGIRPGDLLVATEGGARTIDVRCAATCAVRYVAAGPAIAHAEGHSCSCTS